MNKVINQSRNFVEITPSMVTMKVHPDKIRDIIGKGEPHSLDSGGNRCRGRYRRRRFGAIYAENGSSKDAAVSKIEEITAEAEVGRFTVKKWRE